MTSTSGSAASSAHEPWARGDAVLVGESGADSTRARADRDDFGVGQIASGL